MKSIKYVGLLELADITTGKSNTVDAKSNGKYVFFDRSKEIKYSDKYLFDAEAIIVPGEGSDFIPRYFKGKFDLHQRAYALFPKPNVCGKYLYYAILMQRRYFAQVSTGSTVKSLRLNAFESMKIPVVPLEEQEKIAKILFAFDQKIDVNSKINADLFELSNLLFDVNFPYQIGDELPSGWRLGKYGEIAEFHDSKRIPLSGKERSERKKIYPYYGAASIADYVDQYIFDGTYLLLGEDGTVITDEGKPVLQYVFGKFWVNNHAHVLTGKHGFNVESLYLMSQRINISSILSGAVQPKVSQSNLKNVEIVLPPESVITNFSSTILPLFEKIRNNRMENQKLTVMRDTLIPKLLSGDIDISNVQMPN